MQKLRREVDVLQSELEEAIDEQTTLRQEVETVRPLPGWCWPVGLPHIAKADHSATGGAKQARRNPFCQ